VRQFPTASEQHEKAASQDVALILRRYDGAGMPAAEDARREEPMSSGSGVPAFKGCLTLLGVFALSALAFGIATYIRFPKTEGVSREGAAGFTAFGCAFFVTFAIAFLWEAVRRVQEMAMLRASVAGVPPADGARVAAYGTVVADGPLLEAPMSGARSAIYKYEVIAPRQKSSDWVACSGYGLTPCHIETAAGPVRILGYAEFAFPANTLEGPEARARTQAYLASTAVTPLGVGAAKEFFDTLADDDGAIKSDAGCAVDVVANPRLRLQEHAVADGDTVCAFGRYSSEHGGLVPDPASTDPYPVRLRRGDAPAVSRSLVRSTIGYSVGVLGMSGMAGGVWYLAGLMFAP
jgi:hypothetical protein